MKKILLGTSALAAVALTAGAASADAPTVSMDGGVSYAIVTSSNNNASSAGPGWDVKADKYKSELRWTATGAADNGLEYTGKVDWRYTSMQLDEAWVNIGGGWGSVTLGMEDIVTAGVPDANSLAGGSWGNDGNYKFYGNSGSGLTSVTPAGGGLDSNKVAYYSPDFSGFSFAASIAPAQEDRSGTSGVAVDGSMQNTVGLLASYGGDFGGVGLSLGAGYVMADATDGEAVEDTESYHIGGTVGIAGFYFGAGYVDNGDSGLTKGNGGDAGTKYNVGVSYDGIEDIYLSAIYTAGSSDTDGDNVDLDGKGWSVSADYAVAEGLSTFVEYIYNETDDNANSSTSSSDTSTILLGTTVSF